MSSIVHVRNENRFGARRRTRPPAGGDRTQSVPSTQNNGSRTGMGPGALERPRQTHDAMARFLATGSIED